MSLLSRIRTLSRIRPAPEPDLPEVAGSVAIILDGNGRWAKRRGLPVAAGHRAGARNVRRDAIKHLEELVKNREVGDDEERTAEARVQKLTDEHVSRIDDLLKRKEAEIMEV